MNPTNDSLTHTRPSAIGTFFRGFLTSAVTGALMVTIFAGLATLSVFGAAPFAWPHVALGTLATGLFGGLIAAKRAMFDGPEAGHHGPSYIPVPVQGMSGPALAPAVSPDIAPEEAAAERQPTRQWAPSVARYGDAANRIQQILNNRSLDDKNRAAALLAEREAQMAGTAQVARA